jgi:4-hydroxybenzoate polyprenyltransferase
VAFALLFTVAMALHFVLTDRGLEEHYPGQFGTRSRLLLALALLAGWGAAALFAPSSTLPVALLTALLAGSILLNVFKEELPSNRRSSFPFFLAGLVLYSALLALVTALGE